MRQLQVVGLADDASSVILEDPVRHERFTVACDERLRAAARADVRRLGQMDIETTSPLRPRDIQARVRAGESPEDVAATAGVSAAQVERFAYPVLLERQRVAELATRAHPLRGERPDPRTLGEILAETFAARGQEYDDAVWDAWKGEDGRWIIGLAWRTGRSDNIAHWTFRPGPSAGTLTARDETAHELAGASPPSGPRRSGDRGTHPAPELPLDAFIQSAADDATGRVADRADATSETVESEHIADVSETEEVPDALVANGESLPGPSARAAAHARATRASTSTGRDRPRNGRGSRPAPPPIPGARPTSRPAGPTGPAGPTAPSASPAPDGSAATATSASTATVTPPPGRADASPVANPAPGAESTTSAATSSATAVGTGEAATDDAVARRAKKRHPIVPSWEDVLLGVRSPKG